MKKVLILSGIFMFTAFSAKADTKPMNIMALRPFPAPIVSSVGTSSAIVALPDLTGWFTDASSTINDLAKQNLYFQYNEPYQICPAIYPPIPACLPKNTDKGLATTTLTGLKPNTWYSVRYIKDSSIACIKAPCPTNERKSEQYMFRTLAIGEVATNTASSTDDGRGNSKARKFKRDLWYRTHGDEVKALQEMLINLGFLRDEATGFFGVNTLKAVKNYQRQVMHIAPTGKVGPLTRASLHVDD